MSVNPEVARIRRALDGDARAIAELVDELAPVVQRRVARTLLSDGRRKLAELRTEVEDLCQEVLSALFADDGRLLLAWQPERGLSLQSFVGLIAQRHALSLLRSGKNPFKIDPTDPFALERQAPADGADVHLATEAKQTLEWLAHNLRQRLSPAGLEMFYRLYVWEQSPEEVCQDSGMTLESVYQWRSRIRKAALELRNEATLERGANRRRTAR